VNFLLRKFREWRNRRIRRRMRQVFYTYMPNPNARSLVRKFGPRPR